MGHMISELLRTVVTSGGRTLPVLPGTLSLPAHAILALNHGLRGGPELQRKAKLVSNTAQLLIVHCNVRLPITVPHQPGLGIHAGNAGSGSIEPFLT
jgi:hypothetical protein